MEKNKYFLSVNADSHNNYSLIVIEAIGYIFENLSMIQRKTHIYFNYAKIIANLKKLKIKKRMCL